MYNHPNSFWQIIYNTDAHWNQAVHLWAKCDWLDSHSEWYILNSTPTQDFQFWGSWGYIDCLSWSLPLYNPELTQELNHPLIPHMKLYLVVKLPRFSWLLKFHLLKLGPYFQLFWSHGETGRWGKGRLGEEIFHSWIT